MPASKAKRAQVAARRQRAVTMRAAGASYVQIAEALGYRDHRAAWKDVDRALEANTAELAESANQLRQLAVERLDTALRRVMILVGNQNPELALRAVDRLVRLEERRAKLLGTDAPDRLQADVTGEAFTPAVYSIKIVADPQEAS